MTRKLRNSVTPNPWRLVKRVLPQHTDHAGVVWHGTYIAWLEEARVEALAEAGLAYATLSSQGIEMPVVSLRINYRQSLRHGDWIVVESICHGRKGVRWTWESRLMRGDALIAEADVELVMLQGGFKVLRQAPASLQPVMERLKTGPRRSTAP